MMGTIIRFEDLEPAWYLPRAKEPGFIRSLIAWVAGPAGYINPNPGVALENPDCVVGYMRLPVGNRQAGLHLHSITEIYVILRGTVESYDHTGNVHRAGPFDCLYIPAGAPHGIRNCGREDVELLWVHDKIERKGTSIYVEGNAESHALDAPGVRQVRFDDLEPDWSGHRAKEAGHLRWSVSWVGGEPGFLNHNPAQSVVSANVGLGMTVLQPANGLVPERRPNGRTYVLVGGKVLAGGDRQNSELRPLDAIHVPAGVLQPLRNPGREPAYLIWVDGQPQSLERSEDERQTANPALEY